jgi:hypothetical protein
MSDGIPKPLIDWTKLTLEERRLLLRKLMASVPWKLPKNKKIN